MAEPTDVIRREWHALAGRDHERIVDDLLVRYAEPQRHYHTATHIMWVLHHVGALLAAEASLPEIDRQVVVAAALFHDAIYDPRSAHNELESAVLAVDELSGLGWTDARLAEAASLIEATAGHEATSPAQEVLLDADLAILGANAHDYLAYVAAVRAEYSHVSDQQWRTGRAAVLHGFLEREKIFATPTMERQREHQARANLAAELAELI